MRAQFAHDSAFVWIGDTALRMRHLISADGGRYGAGDLIFWERGTTAFIERGDSVIHRDCTRSDAD